jgi:asparagine synthase (glutamine-hydrolysing)
MTTALTHRGPDGEGLFTRETVALGHRRLSIIDLEGGRQPMANEDESMWITYSEIYNYLEIRQGLEERHRFKTRSDTEVILHLYEEKGERCLDDLRGMFAFAIYDFRERKLFLARDHSGRSRFTITTTAIASPSPRRSKRFSPCLRHWRSWTRPPYTNI